MFKKVLVAISPTLSNDTLVAEAIALAKMSGGVVMLMHVLSPTDDGYPAPLYPGPISAYRGLNEEAIKTYAQQWEAYERQGLEFLQNRVKQVTDAGVTAEFTQSPGDPGTTVCTLAETWGADLIVLGRRGHSGLKEFFLGSVSNYVMHHAPCSVLTIQGKAVSVE